MAVFTVTTAADVVNPGDGVLSLREAAQRANATEAADTILFADALEGRTLTLTQGQLALTGDASVDGDRDGDGTEVTVSGGDASRVLAVSGPGTDVALADLTIADGNSEDVPGPSNGGAGIRADAGVGLTLTGCTLRGNGGYLDGGALFAAAGSEVAVERCVIVGNRAYDGGGIFFEGSRLSVDASYVGRNIAADTSSSGNDGDGGGIAVAAGIATITGSTIAGNSSGSVGGGVSVRDATVSVADSTVAGNAAVGSIYGGGGGLYSSGDLSLANATVTGNDAYSVDVSAQNAVGGGVLSTGALSIANSIVAANFSRSGDVSSLRRDDVEGGITASNGHNLFGGPVAGEAAGDRENVAGAALFASLDPGTGGGRLALNGGPTPTVRLRDARDNPALGGAEPVLAGDADQRGTFRPLPEGTNPDVGSFELAQGAVSRSATAGNDVLTGTAAAGALNGLAGADLLLGLGGGDTLNGSAGGDALRGGPGADRLDGGAGQDTASYRDAAGAVSASLAAGTASGALGTDALTGVENLEGGAGGDHLTGSGLANALGGRTGADRLFGLAGDDSLYGGAGDDLLEGGRGSDRIDGGAGVDRASWFNDGGPSGLDLDLAAGVATRAGERDRLAGVEGADGTDNADLLRGDGLANALGGAGGADRLLGRSGDDALLGALGDDRLNGALGRDALTGGAGTDVFDYDRLADSTVGANRDVITDFAHLTDRIDLATIDARSATATNDAFVFRAAEGAAFTGAGQVRWFRADGDAFVEASVDADRAAELQVELAGLRTLSAGDFVL